jgi:hypothetical protein
MTNTERIIAVYDRIDGILEKVPDNPIYDEKDSRSLVNYLQALRMLQELERNGEYGERNRFNG